MPSGLRVNCTAEASAKYSRCLEIDALISLEKNSPMPPHLFREKLKEVGYRVLIMSDPVRPYNVSRNSTPPTPAPPTW